MILGVGTDILRMQRMRDILDSESESFVRKVYTERERKQAGDGPDPESYFATRFSGKEAVFKCFGIHGNVRLSEIEILDGLSRTVAARGDLAALVGIRARDWAASTG